MTVAIIGTGTIGGTVARHLTAGGERVVLASKDEAQAAALAGQLGVLASAASVKEAIQTADTVVLTVWFDVMKQLIDEYGSLLDGKVVADPSNPVSFATGRPERTLPEGQAQGAVVAGLLPAGAHYVKAFGSLSGPSLAGNANRVPRRAVLFYATDDDQAAAEIERLITVSGFDPVKVGGVEQSLRIEMPGGDLHQAGLGGRVLDDDEARAMVTAA
jgi:predicted dinucleotide-binding enzyme